MDRSLHVRWWRIIAWVAAYTVVAFGLWILDITYLQKNPIIWVSNYSDVVLTIWGIQTTISSLTIASAAFILAKIDDSYYGISIKNLLHLSKHFPKIELSFWEKIISSIILPVVTCVFVILNNITATSFLLLQTVYLATSILIECINVITKSEIYSEWAKEVVDQLIATITAPVIEIKKKDRDVAKKRLRVVIEGIEVEVSSDIRHGMDLYENATYWYLVRLMDHYSGEDIEQFNEQMHDTLIEWLRVAINVKSEQNICTILRASYSESLTSRWSAAGINVFMYSYYHGDVSKSCFQSEIDRITKDILQAHTDYSAKALFVLRNTIDNADENTFVQIIKAVWRSNPYGKSEIKANVLITIITYLYYRAFKERYIPIEKGYYYLDKIRAFSNVTVLESYSSSNPKTIKDILSDTELIFRGANFLLSFFNDRAFHWEYVPLGEAKVARLGDDTIEFLTFYCYLFFRNIRVEDLAPIHLDVLLKMKGYINAEGVISEACYKQYAVFCEWLGKEEELSYRNEWFYISLVETIKKKLIVEAKEIRDKREVWTGKINDMKKETIERVSKSVLCIKGNTSEEACINVRFSDFYLLKNFSEHYAFYGNDQVVQANLEARLFSQLLQHDMFDSCSIQKAFGGFEDSVLVFERMMQQMSEKGINIDRSYNFAFFNRLSYMKSLPHISEKIKELKLKIQDAGQWETGYSGISIYVDSSLMKMGFYAPRENFMTITEELTEEELKYICHKYKTAEGFLFKESSNSTEIPFTEEELIEYLRIAMIKIRYCVPAILPRQKIGFITYYQ